MKKRGLGIKMEIQKVIEGWYNWLTDNPDTKDLATKRLEICIGCEFNSTPNEIKNGSKCEACGCFLKAKAASEGSNCPKNKWK